MFTNQTYSDCSESIARGDSCLACGKGWEYKPETEDVAWKAAISGTGILSHESDCEFLHVTGGLPCGWGAAEFCQNAAFALGIEFEGDPDVEWYANQLQDAGFHVCRAASRDVIYRGLAVIDYDGKQGVVTQAPRWREWADYDDADSLWDNGCWPCRGHHGHWWDVCPDREDHVHGSDCRGRGFDGSRLTTKGVK